MQMLFAVEKQLGLYRQQIEELFALILIMICSVLCLAPDPRSLHACFLRLAMIASDSAASPKTSNALPGAHR